MVSVKSAANLLYSKNSVVVGRKKRGIESTASAMSINMRFSASLIKFSFILYYCIQLTLLSLLLSSKNHQLILIYFDIQINPYYLLNYVYEIICTF